MKNIWIFHHYATLPNLNGHIRPYNFGKIMKAKKIKITIFAASYQHFSDTNLITDRRKFIINNNYEVPFIFVNTPSSKKGGFSRIINMLIYSFRCVDIGTRYAGKSKKPDLIIASSPHPFALIAGIKTARKLGIPCICEIRDLWPEAIFYNSMKIRENSLIGRLMTAGEHFIYKNADALIFTKEGDVDYIKEHKWDTIHGGDIELKKCHYINNGVDLKQFETSINTDVLQDVDLENDKFKVIYCGAIRPVNHVEQIINCAKLLEKDKDIQFLIYGEGSLTEQLRKKIIKEKLTNVKLKGYVEKKYIPYILSKSSLNILNYSSEKYNWSRGNSSNKLFEYMASGKPILSTVKMGYCIISKYNCGISIEKCTPQAMADAIIKVKNMPSDEYEKLGRNAYKAVEDFDYKRLTDKLLKVIESVI